MKMKISLLKKLTGVLIAGILVISSLSGVAFADACATNKLTVTFNDTYNTDQGSVEYSLDGGENWSKIQTNANDLDVNVTAGNLKIRISTDNGFEIELAGTTYKEDFNQPKRLENHDNSDIAEAICSQNGYSVPSDVQSVALEAVEFRGALGGKDDPPPPSTDIPFIISGNIDSDVEIRSDFESEIIYARQYERGEFFLDRDPGNAEKVYISVSAPLFFNAYYDSIIINGVKQENVNGGYNVFEIDASSEGYEIEINGRLVETFNIMWVNSDSEVRYGDYNDPELLIANGKAFTKRVFNNEDEMLDITESIMRIEDGCVDPDTKCGYLVLEPGNVAEFEFLPDYGYQITEININGDAIEPQEEINSFRFVMPDTNIHFSATFTRVEDIVKSNSQKVANGEIRLHENELSEGSAQLIVEDIDDISDSDIESFEAVAGDLSVVDYLNINLNQVFYKGKNDDRDVWIKDVHQLDNNAVVSLQLEDGLAGENVKIIHEKGTDDYEVLDCDFDKVNKIITFETDGFSRYAIAVDEYDFTVKADMKSDAPEFYIENAKGQIMDIIGLSDDERNAIEGGARSGVVLSVEKYKPSDSDIEKIADVLKNHKVGMYFDVKLTLKIEGRADRTIDELSKPLIISVSIPDELKNALPDKLTRAYAMARIHNGVATIIDGEFIPGDDIFVFETDGFSTYALVYSDKEINTAKPSSAPAGSIDKTTSAEKQAKSPKTGDSVKIYFACLMALGIFTVVSYKIKIKI